jgi:hypothetical protein
MRGEAIWGRSSDALAGGEKGGINRSIAGGVAVGEEAKMWGGDCEGTVRPRLMVCGPAEAMGEAPFVAKVREKEVVYGELAWGWACEEGREM